MTKSFCDICGKEVFGLVFAKDLKNYQFSISSNGRVWDICNECREDLAAWMKDRKERPVCQESRHYEFKDCDNIKGERVIKCQVSQSQ